MKIPFSCFFLIINIVTSAYGQTSASAFTYQGQLTEAGVPATGTYDFRACLFDSISAGIEFDCNQYNNVFTDNGLFTIVLDFGEFPVGEGDRYLELQVRSADTSEGFTSLSPRQQIRVVPKAINAEFAAGAGVVPWSGVTGIPAGFLDGIDDNSGGTVTSIAAGIGLAGGVIQDSGTISVAPGGIGSTQIDSSEVQIRVSDTCPPGTYLSAVNMNGTVECQSAMSSLTAGEGLTGGTITSSGTLSVADSGIGADKIAPDAITTEAIQNNAVTAAKVNQDEVQVRAAGTCPIGSYLRGINRDGTLLCEGLAKSTSITAIDSGNTNGFYTSIAIGADQLPIISFHDDLAGTLNIIKCNDRSCSGGDDFSSVIDDSSDRIGLFSSIAIGRDGLPIISYIDDVSKSLKVAKCDDYACAGNNELISVIDVMSGNAGWNSITIGDDGFPVISYIGDFGLKVAKCNDHACSGGDESVVFVDNPGHTVGSANDIAIAHDGLPIISYQDAAFNDLKVVKCNDAACAGNDETITILDNSNVQGQTTSIEVGRDSLPIIAYYDASSGDLKVAKCINVSCSSGSPRISTVDDSSSEIGLWSSLAIGSDGLPVIAYNDYEQRLLKVAKCNDPACSGAKEWITILDGEQSSVGRHNSLAIGSDTLPVIAYADSLKNGIKVAKCATKACD